MPRPLKQTIVEERISKGCQRMVAMFEAALEDRDISDLWKPGVWLTDAQSKEVRDRSIDEAIDRLFEMRQQGRL